MHSGGPTKDPTRSVELRPVRVRKQLTRKRTGFQCFSLLLNTFIEKDTRELPELRALVVFAPAAVIAVSVLVL